MPIDFNLIANMVATKLDNAEIPRRKSCIIYLDYIVSRRLNITAVSPYTRTSSLILAAALDIVSLVYTRHYISSFIAGILQIEIVYAVALN